MYPDKYHRLVGTQAKRRVSPASEAWGLMFRLLQQSKRRFGAIASEFELSPPQVHALRLLDPDEPKPMSELAERLHCDNSNVTGIVDRLEDRGLVERRPAEHDRRVKMLAITPAGTGGSVGTATSRRTRRRARLSSRGRWRCPRRGRSGLRRPPGCSSARSRPAGRRSGARSR